MAYHDGDDVLQMPIIDNKATIIEKDGIVNQDFIETAGEMEDDIISVRKSRTDQEEKDDVLDPYK